VAARWKPFEWLRQWLRDWLGVQPEYGVIGIDWSYPNRDGVGAGKLSGLRPARFDERRAARERENPVFDVAKARSVHTELVDAGTEPWPTDGADHGIDALRYMLSGFGRAVADDISSWERYQRLALRNAQLFPSAPPRLAARLSLERRLLRNPGRFAARIRVLRAGARS